MVVVRMIIFQREHAVQGWLLQPPLPPNLGEY
jgi:hypothetical protein